MQTITSSPPGFSFDIVLKLSERCNLACPYCYYFFQKFEPGGKTAILTPAVQSALPAFLATCTELPGLKSLNIAFHGGEPLMFPKERFVALCDSVRRAVPNSVVLSFSIQTNGVLMDDEWIEILVKNGVKTGFSIDGPEEFHDKCRPDHMGRGSHARTIDALNSMQECARQNSGSPPGAIAVLSPESPSDLLKYFIDDLDVSSPNLNHPRGGFSDEAVQNFNGSLDALRPMVSEYFASYVYPTTYYVRGITDILIALYSDRGAKYNDRKNATRHFIATISSDGEIYADDNLLTIDESLQASPFTLFDSSLRDFVSSEYFSRLTDAIDHTPISCAGCEWYRSCRSGELFNRFSEDFEYDGKSSVCEFIDMIHEECVNFLLTQVGTDLSEIGNRLSEKATCSASSAVDELLGVNL